MTGLLGDSYDDPRSNAIMQLAGGLLSGNFGQGAAAYGATMAGAKDAAMKRSLLQSQIDENASQGEARKLAGIKDARQQALIESMFGPNGGAATPAGGSTSPGAPPNAPPAAGGTAPGGAPNLVQFAKQLGIPEQAIQADMVFNGGKKISELLAERSKPNWQNVNGNLVNTSAQGFSGGLQGGMSSSANGQVTAWQPDGKGGLVVGAPAGAVDTFRAYQGVGAAFKPIKVFNPETQREEYTNEGAVVGGQPGALPNSATTPGSWQAANPGANIMAPRPGESDQQQIYAKALTQAQQQLTMARTPEEQARAQSDIVGIQGAMKRAGIAAPPMRAGGNFAAGPSATEAAANAAQQAGAVTQATANVKPIEARNNALSQTSYMLKSIDGLMNHPGLETGTGLSGTINPRNYIPGTDAKNFRVALDQVKGGTFLQAFESLKSGGAVSEIEGTKATNAIARLNTAQSTEAFKVALTDFKAVMTDVQGRQKAAMPGGAQSPESAKPTAQGTAFDAKPPAQNFKGKTATGPDGKRYKSDGLIWKEVQ